MRNVVVLLAISWTAGCSGGGEPSHDPVDRSPAASDPVIGQLRGREHTVTIYSSPEGPRYTLENAGGEILADFMTLRELEAGKPGLVPTVESLIADKDSGTLIDINFHTVENGRSAGR